MYKPAMVMGLLRGYQWTRAARCDFLPLRIRSSPSADLELAACTDCSIAYGASGPASITQKVCNTSSLFISCLPGKDEGRLRKRACARSGECNSTTTMGPAA